MRKFNMTEFVAVSAMLAAIYAVVTIFAPIPQYQAIQVRFADCLGLLPFFFGWTGVVGLSLGCFVANIFSPYGTLDMIMGTFSTFFSTLTVMYLGKISNLNNYKKNLFIAADLTSAITGVIIGYLLSLYGVPMWFGSVTVFMGEIISVAVIGYPLTLTLRRVLPGVFYVE